MRTWLWLGNRAPLAGAFIAGLALTAAARPADATIARELTRDEMTTRSDLVVRASVLEQRSDWNAEHTQIVTLTHLHITSFLKGTGATDVLLRQFGGTIGQENLRVEGDAHVATGQDVVLFLRGGNEPGIVFLTAMAQSSYVILPQQAGQPPVVQRDLSEVTFATWHGGRMQLVPARVERAESLDHLATDIVRLAGGAR